MARATLVLSAKKAVKRFYNAKCKEFIHNKLLSENILGRRDTDPYKTFYRLKKTK